MSSDFLAWRQPVIILRRLVLRSKKYAAEILASYGLAYDSGGAGNDTRRKISALIAAVVNYDAP